MLSSVGSCLVLGLLSAAVADGATCRVEERGRLPTLMINGRPHSGVCYSNYDSTPERVVVARGDCRFTANLRPKEVRIYLLE